ncbi:hypothetical protein [Caballeronia sp. BR00000012568055]|uniref:hypothetical protein n=1 Tax=Caballeronia sp. BR00000012568055 TaxID=2918761 RepID=UPI0023F7A2E9|nr:hypothetical protein [Caballeronia sp. BR00000012568055]
MQAFTPTNAVERRLLDAHADWLTFLKDRDARVLLWQTSEADRELVRTYCNAGEQMSSAVLCLRTPFVQPARYADALAAEIISFYESRRAGSEKSGIVADWHAPQRRRETGVQYLLRVVESLMDHHPEFFFVMVLVFDPGDARDDAAFAAWLNTLLAQQKDHASLALRLRHATPILDAAPYAGLLRQWPKAARLVRGKYHMQAVPRELAAASGERGPGGQFRRLFIELIETLEHGDPARLDRLRGAALAVARREQWFDQCVVVDLLAGSAYLKWQDHAQAIGAYRAALASSAQTIEAGHPAGDKLAANALFGEASVHLVRRQPLKAAPCYQRAAAHCERAEDLTLAVEAWRMHAWCLDEARWRESAIESGFRALATAGRMEPAMREQSTVPVVAQWMLERIGPLHGRRDALHARLIALFGARWRDRVAMREPGEPRDPAAHSAEVQPQ